MNRTQKKCLIVSSALHLLLPGIIIFGVALMPEDRSRPFTPIKLYSVASITDALSSGGSPNAVSTPLPPAPQPPVVEQPVTPEPPTPRPAQVPTREPEAVKPPPKYSLNPNELKLAKRDDVKPPKDNHAAEEKAAADKTARQAAADARSRLFAKASQNIKSIGKEFSASTEVALSGPGDGGPSAANYRDIVASKYYAAWNTPSVSDDPGSVTVSVTIARDGSVVSHRIIKSSGNSATDKSVQITLENVTFIEVFPASSSDHERTYTIIFDPIVKRSL
jgi:TonB family protein